MKRIHFGESFRRTALLSLALFFFLLLPGHPLGFADGLPLDSFWDWAILLGLSLTLFVFPPRKLPQKWLAWGMAACLLKLFAFGLSATHGLLARYYPWPETGWEMFRGKWARSVEFPHLENGTRIDSKIDFANHTGHPLKARPFPLSHFNRLDYNGLYYDSKSPYYRKTQPSYPFSTEWNGSLYLPKGNWNLRTVSDEPSKVFPSGTVSGGFHPIQVRYKDSDGERRSIRLEIQKSGGEWNLVPSEWLFQKESSGLRLILDRLSLWLTVLLLLGLGGFWVLFWARNLDTSILKSPDFYARLTCFLFVSFFWIGYAWGKWPQDFVYQVAGRGDDPMAFEDGAQRILLGDPFLREIGLFHHMPGGYYFLALIHILCGEGFQWAAWLNWLALGASGYLTYILGKRWFGPWAGLLACIASLIGWPNWGYAKYWYPELLTRPLSLLILLVFSRFTFWRAFLGGAFLGMAIWLRVNLLASLVLGILFLAFSRISSREKRYSVFGILLGTLIVLSPLLLRNYALGKKIVIVRSEQTHLALSIGMSSGGLSISRERPYSSWVKAVIENPGIFLKRVFRAFLWGSLLDPSATRQSGLSWKGWAASGLYSICFLLGLIGMFGIFLRGPPEPVLLFAIGYYLGVVGPCLTILQYNMGNLRFWLPGMSIQYLFAAGGIFWVQKYLAKI